MTTQKPTGVFVPFPLTEAQVSAYSDARAKAWMEQGIPTATSAFETGLLAIGTPFLGETFETVGWVAPELFTHFGKIPTGTVISSVMTDSRTLPLVRQSEAQAQIAVRDAEIVRLRDVINKMTSMSMNSGAWLSNNRIANCRDELSAMTRLGSNTLKGGAA